MDIKRFNAKKQEHEDLLESLLAQITKAKTHWEEIKNAYIAEAIAESGYAIGQPYCDSDGKIWYVSGAHEYCGRVYLTFNFEKKDGTMSKVSGMGRGMPCVRIK